MATCDLGYEHADPAPEPAPVIVEPGPNENDVKIAEIQAAAEVQLAEVRTEQAAIEAEVENESLRGELRGIRETLDRIAPPEPVEAEQVVMPAMPAPAPAAEPAAEAVPDVMPPRKTKNDSGWWAGYR